MSNNQYENLIVLLDSYITQHIEVNSSFINYHKKAFKSGLIILNAPALTALQNELYVSESSKIFEYDYLVDKSKSYEAIGLGNYGNQDGVKIYSLITDESEIFIREAFDKISAINVNDLASFVYRGVQIGRLAFIDLSLVLKGSKRNIEDIQQNNFFRLTLFYIYLIISFLEKHLGSVAMVFQNSLYSTNNSIRQYVEKNHPDKFSRFFIPLHNGMKLQNFSIVEHPSMDGFLRRKFSRNYHRAQLIDSALEYAIQHLGAHVFGSSPFKYSPEAESHANRDVYDVLNIPRDCKIYVYNTNSPDEEIASDIFLENVFVESALERRPFQNEVQAIRFLSDKLQSEAAYLVVRFHPRMGAEPRTPLESDRLNEFLSDVKIVQKSNPRLIIIDPYEKISSYWLTGWADGVFSLRGSMAQVLPLMGVPFMQLSDNRGMNLAEYDIKVINNVTEFDGEIEIDEVDLSSMIDLIYGYYISNFHASFKPEESESPEIIDIFIKSVKTGYSCIAFLPNASCDLHQPAIDVLEHPKISAYYEFLKTRIGELSSCTHYPLKLRIENLIANLPKRPLASARYRELVIPKFSEAQDIYQEAHRLFSSGSHLEALDALEYLADINPEYSLHLLKSAYDLMQGISDKHRREFIYQLRKFEFQFDPVAKVLDIGWNKVPFEWATHFVEPVLPNPHVRATNEGILSNGVKERIKCNFGALPFHDKSFDFVYCSNVLEYAEDPERACKELMRVGRKGYIETLNGWADQWTLSGRGNNHRWVIERVNKRLIFTERSTGDVLSDMYSDLAYQICRTPQSDREKAISAMTILKPQQTKTMFIWEDSFDFMVRRLQ